MSRDPLISLEDIRDAVERILRYTEGLDRPGFLASDLVFAAVVRNLEVIGEAAKNVPEDLRQRYPVVEWRKLAGLRDILAHAYFGLDGEIIWDVVANKLPALGESIDLMLRELSS